MNNLSNLMRLCHLVWVLVLLHYELEPPELVRCQSEPATDGRPARVAQKPEIFRKEEIIDVLWGCLLYTSPSPRDS